jgi:hypothetical protein
VKNMNDYVFNNIDKTAHDADDTQAVGTEDFTDLLQRVMASLDDNDSDSDDNAAEAAPPAPIIASVPPPAPIIASVPLPAPSISTPAAIRNNDSDGSHFGPILLAPQTAPATVPNPVAMSAPRSCPAAIPADVAAVAYMEGVSGGGEGMKITVQKKGRRKGKAVAGTDVAPRHSSHNGA